MDPSIEDYVHRRIAGTPVEAAPFPHQYVRPVFPDDFYRTLRAHLPAHAAYTALGKTGTLTTSELYPERRVVDVASLAKQERAAGQAGFWDGFTNWILGASFIRLLLECYRPYVVGRFGEGARIATKPQARLVCDLTNYALGPHTDAPYKLLSLLFYLPADDARPHLGTSLYAPLDPGFRCAGGPHHPFDRFRRTATMPYVPNALFLFFKTDNAFHGVEPVSEPQVERNIIQFNLYVTQDAAPRIPA